MGTWGNLGETRGAVGKSGMLENKSGNISETRKDRGKLLWTTYRNSQTLFRTVPSPTPYDLPLLEIGDLQLSYPLLSQEKVKLRTFKFDRYIYRANPNKSPLIILEKRERGRIQGVHKFFGYHLLFRNGSRGRNQGVQKIFRAPCIGRIARSSLR